jgi:hypothetical protein
MEIEAFDVAIHMMLEGVGGLIAWYAYGYCSHWYHRLTIWTILAFIFSVLTVGLVG